MSLDRSYQTLYVNNEGLSPEVSGKVRKVMVSDRFLEQDERGVNVNNEG